MIDGSQVFVDIDTQRDFLEPTGALYVPGATEIVPNLDLLTRFALERGIPILATACAHTPDDPELAMFPPHCLVGTPGQERVEATFLRETLALSEVDPLPAYFPPHLTLLKRELDLFSHPHAEAIIARYRSESPVFVVYGVATDYCVSAAIRGLLKRHCRIALVVDAIRAIDARVEGDILTGFANKGVVMVRTGVVCDPKTKVRLE
jgi:nicotinamidase/pyrazinamidase